MRKKEINFKEPFTNNYKNYDSDSECKKAYSLLRRVYNKIELSHLTDHKLVPDYIEPIKFPRSLGEDIFNLLQSKDNIFRQFTIRRQKNYRRKIKKLKKRTTNEK